MTRTSLLCVCIAAAGLTAACEKEKQKSEPVIRPVRYLEVEASGGLRKRTFSGVSEAGETSVLSFKVAGTIEKLNVKLGDKVSKGQLIAELGKTELELQVQQARASYSSAKAQERNANAKYSQVQALFENRNASKADLDSARASRDMARGQVSAAAKQVELAREGLSHARLVAPADGAIAAVLHERNENVAPGTPVVQLSSGDKTDVSVAMPEMLIAQVVAGQSVTVRFDSLPNKTLTGTVSEVGVSSMRSGATFPVTVTLDENDTAIRPGMAAEVEFSFGSESETKRILVPSAAVGEDRNGRFVFVVKNVKDDLGQVERVPVEIGELSDEGLEITKGLDVGQLLVTAGVSRISDGLTVKVPPQDDIEIPGGVESLPPQKEPAP